MCKSGWVCPIIRLENGTDGIIIWPCNVSPLLYCKGGIKNQDNCPLLSCRDIRILIIALLTEDDGLSKKELCKCKTGIDREKKIFKDTLKGHKK